MPSKPFQRVVRFEVVVGGRTTAVERDRDGVVRAAGEVLGRVRRDPEGSGVRRFVGLTPEGRRATAGPTGEAAAVSLAYARLRR